MLVCLLSDKELLGMLSPVRIDGPVAEHLTTGFCRNQL
jgi:hypothetical protein